MRKISLLLALLMVATCCMLASCGEEETSSAPEVSSEAPATSSEAPATSSEEPEVESSEPEAESSEEPAEPEFEKNPDAIPTEGANVAAGKTYVVSEQYHQNTETWTYDEAYPVVYPDNGTELTDGTAPAAGDGYGADGWTGFNNNTPAQASRGYAYITVDLTEIYEFATVSVTTYAQTDVGISAPAWIKVLVSEDGENFFEIGSETLSAGEDGVSVVDIACDATGRYVQIQVNGSSAWSFIGEIEVK